GVVEEAERAARIHERMLADEVLDLALGVIVQRIVGRAHVGELGVAALPVDDARREQGVLGGDRPERAVRMPQHVAEVKQALAAVAGERPAILAEVGDVVHPDHQPLVLGLGDVAAARILDGAEVDGERHLLLVGQLLAGKHQHGILVHAGLDGRHVRGRNGLADVDARNLADENGMELADADRHGVVLASGALFAQYPCAAHPRQPFLHAAADRAKAGDELMQIGVMGLGRMGANIARRLMRHGHGCVVYDRDPAPGRALAGEGATAAASAAEFVRALSPPRVVWVMLPAGAATENAIGELSGLLAPGDTIIDGGNSFWKDDVRRARELKARGLGYLDVGTSGGVWGLERGYCLMIGGEKTVVDRLDPIFAALAPGMGDIPATSGRSGRDPRPEQGYLHAGDSGAGHFVKMIHNGIEYGMMQAIAEGLDILKNAGSERLPAELRLSIDVADVAEVWR